MKELIVEPEAEAELERGVDWYEKEASGKGAALAEEAEARLNRFALPGAIGVRVPGVREDLPVRRFFLEGLYTGALVCGVSSTPSRRTRPDPLVKR